jgi:uncharacterized membrane protein YqgA involved in biofilm formation
MIGTMTNVLLVLAGGALGLLIKKGLPKKSETMLFQVIGLFTLGLGIFSITKTIRPVSLILGFMLGSVVGELVGLEDMLSSFGEGARKALHGGERFVDGMVVAFVTFCVGPMTILGAIQDGLGDPTILVVKSIMDGSVSVAYASTFGAGVLLSTVPMLLYQLPLTFLASSLKPYMTQVVLDNLSAQGGILLLGLGINLLEIKKVKVANMLPAIVTVPLVTLLLTPLGF